MSEREIERMACCGAPTLEVSSGGVDMRECVHCGTAVRWDLTEHKFWGFVAGCRNAPPALAKGEGP